MAKLSLCLITGNAEEYIERCLESFLPIADEVILVRAVGSRSPDKTLELASKIVPHLITGEYRNKPEHADWPHVDDFAAARQMSFDLATGEYIFWCDTDDVLEDGSAPIVRELANRGGYAAFVFPYKIFGRGVSVPRERMILKGAGKWLYPVHECFKFKIEPVQAIEDNRVAVIHRPHLNKNGSNERNLRILRSIPDKDLTPGLMYHLQGELAVAGETVASIKMAERALKSPGLGRPERYELFMNLAQMGTAPRSKETMLQQAYAADPRRREALGLLACHAMDSGENDMALAYARQMLATLPPASPDWNDRAAVYGWLGDEIYTQALRVNGFTSEAEILRLEMLKRAGGPRIALIHATRGRPQQAAMTRKVWLDMAEKPDQVEHIFVMDDDDEKSVPLRRMHNLVIQSGGGCVAAWNLGCFATQAKVVVQLSDDWVPLPMWDKLILDRIGDVNQPRVLAISDGVRKDDLLCMAICTRAYLDLDYFMFHPEFTGVYSDNWFTELAYKRGMVIEAKDLQFVHNHPVTTGKPMDETYTRQNAPERYKEGNAIWKRLQRHDDWSDIPGFYNYWPFYQSVADKLKSGDSIAEVGVWFGRSVIHMAQMLKSQGKAVKVYAVDHFVGEIGEVAHAAAVKAEGGNIRAAFERNASRCGVSDMIEVLDGDSAKMASNVADGSLTFCYIDAAHDYESVKRDLAAWAPKVKKGGMIAGHDAQHEPVVRAVKERFPQAEIIGPIWMAQL